MLTVPIVVDEFSVLMSASLTCLVCACKTVGISINMARNVRFIGAFFTFSWANIQKKDKKIPPPKKKNAFFTFVHAKKSIFAV